jgi:HK97 family phage major capsid protein
MDPEELKALVVAGNKTIDALRGEVDGMKSADVLTAQKIARMESSLADTLAAKQAAELQATALEKRLSDIETKAARPGQGGASTAEADEYKSAFVDYVRNPNDHNRANALFDLAKKATDVRTNVGASGGFALPQEIAADIAKQVQDVSPIRQIARVVQVGTSDYKELVDLNGFGTEWVGETVTRSQTDTPGLGECAPTFGSLVAKPETTRESLEDLFFDVEAWLTMSAVEQMAVAEGVAFISGNGVNKPTGILAGTPVVTADAARAFGVLQFVASGNAATLGSNPFDLTKSVVYGLKSGYRANANWLMNSLTLAQLAKVKDANGVYLLQRAVAAGVPSTIEGYNAMIAEDMPDVAANALPIAFGDFKKGYLIADRAGLAVVKDEVTKAGYIRYQMFKRLGGKVKDSNAIKLLKIAA